MARRIVEDVSRVEALVTFYTFLLLLRVLLLLLMLVGVRIHLLRGVWEGLLIAGSLGLVSGRDVCLVSLSRGLEWLSVYVGLIGFAFDLRLIVSLLVNAGVFHFLRPRPCSSL